MYVTCASYWCAPAGMNTHPTPHHTWSRRSEYNPIRQSHRIRVPVITYGRDGERPSLSIGMELGGIGIWHGHWMMEVEEPTAASVGVANGRDWGDGVDGSREQLTMAGNIDAQKGTSGVLARVVEWNGLHIDSGRVLGEASVGDDTKHSLFVKAQGQLPGFNVFPDALMIDRELTMALGSDWHGGFRGWKEMVGLQDENVVM
ncbi:uncharacterized protein LACBIDRAFT_326037 [Laccaria bicolor S238N-H82]|uniref:Predicted protein n=1 Tax=Laccaria bicolor (strain S238N-H82 / ATCC MYA-4686) TaxID=486041 RepID=B0D735_LACBS|nr:uncharacterized protein LACBIDRAFT_326037 [Laccaria bicolor S238N-H82]EDR09580.1 predicted protein [Laccaria bicolor S238N-H82]|eukprot:XP_001879929.1 predicted protein [Laccaria bicolor S238N-H82]